MSHPARVGIHHVEHVMGMAVSIDVRDSGCHPDALVEVVEWLHHVDDTFSTHQHGSPISAIGRGELSVADTTEEIRDVLRLCETVRQQSGGVFDVFQVPAPNGTQFDPSGLVKGWSVQRSAELLESHGCVNYCINAGGDIVIGGVPAHGHQWRVGIRHPDQSDRLAAVIAGQGHLAVATSATYERGAHIIDPRTRQPTTEIASATVVGPDLTFADAYATAVFVMGVDGLDWITTMAGYDAYVITHDAQTHWSPGFARYRASDTSVSSSRRPEPDRAPAPSA